MKSETNEKRKTRLNRTGLNFFFTNEKFHFFQLISRIFLLISRIMVSIYNALPLKNFAFLNRFQEYGICTYFYNNGFCSYCCTNEKFCFFQLISRIFVLISTIMVCAHIAVPMKSFVFSTYF